MSIPSIQNQPMGVELTAGFAATVPLSLGRQPDTSRSTTSQVSTSRFSQPVDLKQLQAAVDKVQKFTQTVASELKFNIDEDSGRTIIKIIDASTDEIIRQIPSEEMLAIAKALDQIQGLLIKAKA